MLASARPGRGRREWGWLIWAAYLAVCAAYAGLSEYRQAGLVEVRAAGVLRVITRNSAHCFYYYRDEPMGLEYELALALAEHLGVRLELTTAHRWEHMLPDLLGGRADIVAAGLTATPERRALVAFSRPYLTVRQRLVVHRTLSQDLSVADLGGRSVHVGRGTAYQTTLDRLRTEGLDVRVEVHDDLTVEELIRQVAEGAMEITVADSTIAQLNRRYYPEARIAGELSGDLPVAWAVHPQATGLRREIDRFFGRLKANGRFDEMYQRTYGPSEGFDYVDLRAFHRSLRTRLPRYQPLIEEAAARYGFDWRLLAAQMYQESHFRPQAQSASGALGLMQLLPRTARALGVRDAQEPAENITAGVRHLSALHARAPGATDQDRLYLALAAYNVGYGHVQDARHLARRRGLDPDRWSSVARTLPLLSQQRYYRQTTHGYCRGEEPVRYVARILTYYDILRRREIRYQEATPAGS
jgi:membrane-bound lytic murein transglycosylase F